MLLAIGDGAQRLSKLVVDAGSLESGTKAALWAEVGTDMKTESNTRRREEESEEARQRERIL